MDAERRLLPPWSAVRLVILLPVLLNVALFVLAGYVAITALKLEGPSAVVFAAFFLMGVTGARLLWLAVNGCIQGVTALAMVAETPSDGKASGVNYRRRWYGRWRWSNRFGRGLLILQVVAACVIARNNTARNENHLQALLKVLPVTSFVVVFLGLLTGSEVFSRRSLYTNRKAWKAHYTQAFRFFIVEALCCYGQWRHLRKEQKEDVCSVADLLGHLVTYRAEGCSHWEVLAGVSLLRKDGPAPESTEPAPESISPADDPLRDLLLEASILHPFAVASYTGPLLELGRHPYCWLFVWLYNRVLRSWKCCRPRVLEGDNFFRGHATAFLRRSRLTPKDGCLLAGRVLQTKREPAYFVVVLHKLRTVVVAVRGTETPDDFLTDGLSSETPLSESDLLGVSEGLEGEKHYAHNGIIEAARELLSQLDKPSIGDHRKGELPRGLLTELRPGGKFPGYRLRLVGHSLGGSIAALVGLMLYRRYRNLHVYAFGSLPCVDKVIAEKCQRFVTSFVYRDEFSSRLSVASLMRLRVKAELALSGDITRDNRSSANIALRAESSSSSGRKEFSELTKFQRVPYVLKGAKFFCAHTCFCICKMSQHHEEIALPSEVERSVRTLSNRQGSSIPPKSQRPCLGIGPHEQMTRVVPPQDSHALYAFTGSNETRGLTGSEVDIKMRFLEDGRKEVIGFESSGHGALSRRGTDAAFVNSSDEEAGGDLRELYPSEMYLPGQVLHILPLKEEPAVCGRASFWHAWKAERTSEYRVVEVDRSEFRDLVISPTMFIDHMPWKCQYALNLILKSKSRRCNNPTAGSRLELRMTTS